VGLKAKQTQEIAWSIGKEISPDANHDIDALVKEAIAKHRLKGSNAPLQTLFQKYIPKCDTRD
jgi:hypothetical protein